MENDRYFNDHGSGITLSQVLGTYSNPTYYSPITIPVGPFSDYSKIDKLVRQDVANRTLVLDPDQTGTRNFGSTWDLNERVYAGYLMNDITFGKASLQTGLRIHATDTRYSAYQDNLVNRAFNNAVPLPPRVVFVEIKYLKWAVGKTLM